MSTEIETAEQLAQSALDVGVVDHRDLQSLWSELGTHTVTLEEFQRALLRRNLLTTYQLERLQKGLKSGFFYGDYKVLYCAGVGTFARVFRAAHRETNKQYAVKVLRKSKSEEAAAFRREGEFGSTLKHPNIVEIHEVVSKRDTHYIVMDFIEGRTLREFLRVRKKVEAIEAAKIIEGVMAGLNYAFLRGVTHRDLKMTNVLISSDGVAKLVDFGLAALDSEGAGEATNKRTIEYAALERATGVRKDDTRSDIFFAGCMLYHLLSGKSPIPEGRDRGKQFSKSTFQDIPPLLSVAPKVPPMLAKVTQRAIEFDPQKRYQAPAEMLTDLKLVIRRLEERGTADEIRPELASDEGLDAQGQSRRLMVVEANVKMQDILRDLFKRHGYRVLVASDPARALDRFYADTTSADIVLFSSGHIGQAALDIFNKFGQEPGTRDVPAILLLDESHRQWQGEAQVGGHRAVALMPIKQRELRQIVRQVLNAQPV